MSSEDIWPQKYGFKIVGNGPTFVVSVEPRSEAEESGLVPGDRIMELDGHNISRLSADVLTILMKETNGHPPAVGVVPNSCSIYLTCKIPQKCGFNVNNKKPITVSHVEPTGIAFAAGLRKGDIILAVNNKPINKLGRREWVLIAENERLVLSTIPAGIRETTITNDFRGPQINTSKFLFTKVAKYCGTDYHKKMALVGALTEYSEDWDIHSLCLSLDNLLKEPSDRKLLKYIEPFIPRHQKDFFKPLLKKKKLYKDCNHLAYIPNKPAQKLSLRILRGNNPYGLVIKGSCPPHVEWIHPGGPADAAGFLSGDFIVTVNEIDTRSFRHDQVIKLFQFCGPVPTVGVERYAGSISEVGINTSFDTLSNVSSTFSVESSYWIYTEFSHVTDSEGWTFKQKMEYLLTPKERAQLQMDFLHYINSRNIVKLYHRLNPLLDCPSRRILWQYLLTKMSTSHQEYIHLKENLSETLRNKSMKNLIEYYLSYKEEVKLKDALDHYLKNRNFEQVKIIERILNTPAKEELWHSIFPHLIPEHLHIIQKQREEQKRIFANFHQGIVSKRSSNIYLPPNSESNWGGGHDSDEEFKLLEAAVDSVHISDDSLPSNLSSEEDINGINPPGFYGNSISASTSSSFSKTPKCSPAYDFTESKSLQRKQDEPQNLILAYGSQNNIPSTIFKPQKPRRKTTPTSNHTTDSKLFSENIQYSHRSDPFAYNNKAPSLPNMFSMSTMDEDLETKSLLHLPERQPSPQLIQIKKESKNPLYNYPKESPFAVKSLDSIDHHLESNDEEDDSDCKYDDDKIAVQNLTETDKTLPVQNMYDMTPVFTYGNTNNGFAEETTFGPFKSKSQNHSSKSRITPDSLEDKKEDMFGHKVISTPDTQGTRF